MARQRLVKSASSVNHASDLGYGQLGRINEGEAYRGCIITKIHSGFVCVYSPLSNVKAFETTWDKAADFEVVILENDAQVILSNG